VRVYTTVNTESKYSKVATLKSSVADTDPLVRGTDPDPDIRLRILLSSSKNSKKNLDSYCFVTSL
jgi:hypothetical protein